MTLAIVRWISRRTVSAGPFCPSAELERAGASAGGGESPSTPSTIRQSRLMKRQAPSMPASVHSRSRSGGLSESMKRPSRIGAVGVDHPSGSTTFLRDFDIFSERPTTTGSPSRAPRPVALTHDLVGRKPCRRRRGIRLVADHALRHQPGERLVDAEIAAAPERPGEEPRIEEVQNRMLDAADVLIDRQPVIHGTPVERLGACGEQKRAKYHEDLEKRIEGIGLPNRPGPRQFGQAVCFHVGCRSSGLPGRLKSTSSGSVTGRSAAGTGTMPHAAQCRMGIGQPQYRCRRRPNRGADS